MINKKNNNSILIRKADKELYSFWDQIYSVLNKKHEFLISNILVIVLRKKIVASREVVNLYKLSQKFPDSTILNLGNQPVLHIKLV